MERTNNPKPLFKIENLKQWFPLKKKGLYVKANDGIDLTIYEGETLGLVGESGCGKSTLGRTLLQLYKQTDGRTMYYGRSLLDVAPRYFLDTVRSLEKRKQKAQDLKQELEKAEQRYAGLSEEDQFKEADKMQKLRRSAKDEDLHLTSIIGGLVVLDDLGPVKEVHVKLYQAAKKLSGLRAGRKDINMRLKDAEYRVSHGKSGAQRSVDKYSDRLKKQDLKIEAAQAELQQVQAELDQLRAKYADRPDFIQEDQKLDHGIDLARLSYNEMRHIRVDMQLIFQDPYSSLDSRQTVGQIIGEGMLTHKLFRRNDDRMKDRVLEIMDDCGLAPYFLHRYPHQFSGGQRQRIGIARALSLNPKFIVCDEAVSALDVSIQSQVINLLQELKEKQNLTYLFITHDLSVVKYISDRIAVMYLGVIVELAESHDMFEQPLHPYTEALLSAIPTADEESGRELVVLEGDIPSPVNAPPGCKFHTRCRYATEVCKHVIPEMREVEAKHFVACHHPLNKKVQN